MIDREPKQVEIPAHWQYPEREAFQFGVGSFLQVDPDHNLLSFRTLNDPDFVFPKEAYDNYTTYIFGPDGKPTDTIRNKDYKTYITLQREEREDIYIEHYGPDFRGVPGYSQVTFLFGQDYKDRLFGEGYDDHRSSLLHGWPGNLSSRSVFIECEVSRHRINENPLAVPHVIVFGIVFDGLESEEKYEANSPFIVLNRFTKNGGKAEPEEAKNWKLFVEPLSEPNNGYAINISQNEHYAYFVNKQKGLSYQVEWAVENGTLVLSQIQMRGPKAEVTKILNCPLFIDLNPVTTALAVRPPYEKDDNGQYRMPWRNLDRALGVRLGYNYPPPKSKQNARS